MAEICDPQRERAGDALACGKISQNVKSPSLSHITPSLCLCRQIFTSSTPCVEVFQALVHPLPPPVCLYSGPDLFYFEVIECGRRILLTGVLIFVKPHSSMQVATACIFAFGILVGFELMRPYVDPTDEWLYRLVSRETLLLVCTVLIFVCFVAFCCAFSVIDIIVLFHHRNNWATDRSYMSRVLHG